MLALKVKNMSTVSTFDTNVARILKKYLIFMAVSSSFLFYSCFFHMPLTTTPKMAIRKAVKKGSFAHFVKSDTKYHVIPLF